MSYAVSDTFVLGVTLDYRGTKSTFAEHSGKLEATGYDQGVFANYTRPSGYGSMARSP